MKSSCDNLGEFVNVELDQNVLMITKTSSKQDVIFSTALFLVVIISTTTGLLFFRRTRPTRLCLMTRRRM
jgi:hypothetical protein